MTPSLVLVCMFIAYTLAAAGVQYKPYSSVNPTTLGFPSLSRQGVAEPVAALWGNTKGPLPTNAWWENLVLGDGVESDNNVMVSPYTVVSELQEVRAVYSFMKPVGADQVEDTFDDIDGWVSLSTAEGVARTVKSHDDVSVTLQFGTADKTMDVPLVRGSPFMAAIYNGLTPLVFAPIPASKMSVDRGNKTDVCTAGSTVKGSRFEIEFQASDSTWVLYTSAPVVFVCNTSSSFALTATAPVSNLSMQWALVNNCTYGHGLHCVMGKPADAATYTALIDQYSNTVVTGGDVSWVATGDTVSFTYAWKTLNGGTVLACALPHHVAHFDTTTAAGLQAANLGHRNIRGWNRMVAGNTWVLTLSLPPVSFTSPRAVPTQYTKTVLDALLNKGNSSDMNFDPPFNYQMGIGDTYFSGKMYAKQARIAMLADELGQTDVAMQVAGRLKHYLEVWLNSTSGAQLLYDSSWGGFISCGCLYDDCQGTCTPHCDNKFPDCPALSDAGMNFGNGFYNDHHFHYGYFLNAFAAVSKFYPDFAAKYKEHMLLFARDIANPSSDDGFFPRYRHKDWYFLGSWAGGVPLAGGKTYYNGRNQESTSEAVNAYYALALFGLSIDNQDMVDIGRVMAATEILAAQTFWHVPAASDIYPSDYKSAHTMVGILWSNLAQFQTWFGLQPYLIHGVQTIPFTPITEQLLPISFVQEEYPQYQASCKDITGCFDTGWGTFMVMEQAIVDRVSAWTDAQSLPDSVFMDAPGNGNSRLNTLHWIATRP